MKKEDVKYLIIFLLLIGLIISCLIFDHYRERKLSVDRKIEYIYKNYSYDKVLQEGKTIFKNSLVILNVPNYKLEKNSDNQIELYNIDGQTGLKKIIDFGLIYQTFTKEEVTKFLKDYNIIIKENNYYLKDNSFPFNPKYVGSTIKIYDYNSDYITFESYNYYCEDGKYEGIIDHTPACKYTYNTTYFKITEEDNNLKLLSYEDILSIVK